MTPVFKKGDKTQVVNYRPISFICILFKVLEHTMAFQIVKHMNEHSLLYDLQHGFREKRSYETQVTMLVKDLARNASKGKQTDLILLDFSKAFDKGCVHTFLSNISQSVVVGVDESDLVSVCSGVPQGSILGPHLHQRPTEYYNFYSTPVC